MAQMVSLFSAFVCMHFEHGRIQLTEIQPLCCSQRVLYVARSASVFWAPLFSLHFKDASEGELAVFAARLRTGICKAPSLTLICSKGLLAVCFHGVPLI